MKRFGLLVILFPLLAQADSTVGEWPYCKECAARAAERRAKEQRLVSTAKAKAASTAVQSGSAGSVPAQGNPPKP